MFSWMSVPAFFSCCEDGGDGEDHVGCQASEARLEPTAAAAVRRAYAGAAEMNYRAAWKMRREMGQKRARDASSEDEEEEVEAEEEEMSAPRNPGSPAAARRRRNRCESGSPLRLCRGRVSWRGHWVWRVASTHSLLSKCLNSRGVYQTGWFQMVAVMRAMG